MPSFPFQNNRPSRLTSVTANVCHREDDTHTQTKEQRKLLLTDPHIDKTFSLQYVLLCIHYPCHTDPFFRMSTEDLGCKHSCIHSILPLWKLVL